MMWKNYGFYMVGVLENRGLCLEENWVNIEIFVLEE